VMQNSEKKLEGKSADLNTELKALCAFAPVETNWTSLCAEVWQTLWPQVENCLLQVKNFPEFAGFLSGYRGFEESPRPEEIAVAVQEKIGEPLFEIIQKGFLSFWAQCQKPQASDSVNTDLSAFFNEMARCFESFGNLLFFLWNADADRNFQFRTVLHFGGLEGLGAEIVGTPLPVALSFSRYGLRLGSPDKDFFPRRLSFVWSFFDKKMSQALFEKQDQGSEIPREALFIARLRSLQREICLMIDDWEHENAQLAVEHARARQRSVGQAQALEDVLQRMAQLRDEMSLGVAESLTLAQFLCRITNASTQNSDVSQERDAACALVLSAMQKVFLPASVSRHKYHRKTLEQVSLWAQERLVFYPHDTATRLLLENLAMVLSDTAHVAISWENWLGILAGPAHAFTLDFDPSSALKFACWGLNWRDHLFFSAVAFVLVAKKLNPTAPNSHWLNTVASVVQMPETFPAFLPVTQSHVPPHALEKVCHQCLEILEKCKNKADEDCLTYLRVSFEKGLDGSSSKGNI
jgi:hypothetical protein